MGHKCSETTTGQAGGQLGEVMSLLPLEDSSSVVVIWKSGGKEALELHPSIGEEGSTEASNSFFMMVDSFLH